MTLQSFPVLASQVRQAQGPCTAGAQTERSRSPRGRAQPLCGGERERTGKTGKSGQGPAATPVALASMLGCSGQQLGSLVLTKAHGAGLAGSRPGDSHLALVYLPSLAARRASCSVLPTARRSRREHHTCPHCPPLSTQGPLTQALPPLCLEGPGLPWEAQTCADQVES